MNKKITFITGIIIILIAVILVYINLQLCKFESTELNYIESNSDIDQIITIPGEIVIDVGDSIRVTALAVNKFNRILKRYQFVWNLEDSDIAELENQNTVIGLSPGQTEIVVCINDVSMEKNIPVIVIPPGMVYIPAGSFLMGGGEDRPYNEKPQREIYLDSYFIDKYEVTNSEFAIFLNSDDQYFDTKMDIINENGVFIPEPGKEKFPVAFVSWKAADAYSKWFGKRLPTEAEWERAARGDMDRREFPLISEPNGMEVNFRNSGDPYDNSTTPVGIYNGHIYKDLSTRRYVTPHGVFDMAGNLAEWVSDWYDKRYYRTGPEKNPKGPSKTIEKTIRGGSWFDIPKRLRVSYRTSGKPDLKNEMVGFRCAKSVN